MAIVQSGHSSSKEVTQGKQVSPENCISSFFKFPPEVRNNIYDLVCVKPTYIGSNNGKAVTTVGFYKDAATWRSLPFASSCKQIYIECSHIYYSRNGFEFRYVRPLLEFLEAIGLGGRILLTKLRFIYGVAGTSCYVALRYLKSCKNLKDLDIWHLIQRGWCSPMIEPLDFFLGNRTEVEFGEPLPFGDNRRGCMKKSLVIHAESSGRKSLTESLKKLKSGEDGKWKCRDLPDVFAESGLSSVYRNSLVKIRRKSEEEEYQQKRRMKEIKNTEKEIKDMEKELSQVQAELSEASEWPENSTEIIAEVVKDMKVTVLRLKTRVAELRLNYIRKGRL